MEFPRDFSRIDPNMIEDITILKDAAAVAPYGMAGANGGILVNNKKGKKRCSGTFIQWIYRFSEPDPHH